jgi:hypothetical protein
MVPSMINSQLELKKAIIETADRDGARALVNQIAPALDRFADQVWCFGIGVTPDERRALGLVAQMGGELLLGASAMFEATRLYAGASLVRQVIEIDYLLFLFGMDSNEASRWLNASQDEMMRLFKPSEMRKRSAGRFDVDEYSRHCEMGGHPRPAGAPLVDRHHLASVDPLPIMWVDLANHAVRIWDNYKIAAATCSPTNVYPERWAPVDVACDIWVKSSEETRKMVAKINLP